MKQKGGTLSMVTIRDGGSASPFHQFSFGDESPSLSNW